MDELGRAGLPFSALGNRAIRFVQSLVIKDTVSSLKWQPRTLFPIYLFFPPHYSRVPYPWPSVLQNFREFPIPILIF